MKIGYLMQVGEEIRQPPFNGPANHIRQLFQAMIRRGHKVRILFRLNGKIWKTDDLISFSNVEVKWIDHGPWRFIEKITRRFQSELHLPYIGFFESLRFAMACRQELRGCEVLLERLSWMTYGGALIRRWMNVPFVLEYNGDPLADLEAHGLVPQGTQKSISVNLLSWNIHKADSIVVTGEGWKKNCIEKYSVPPERVYLIENGSDLVRILRRENLHSFRSDNEEDSVTRLVYLGGFYPWHGVDGMLCAVDNAVRLGADLKLILIGAGPGMDHAVQLTEDLGLSPIVTFTGNLQTDQYALYLAKADIGLSPYCGWEEFSGLKIFDYKAAGLACIASGKNGQPSSVVHGQTGWIITPCDEDALCEAILYFANHRQVTRRMGQASRIQAEDCHSWDRTVEKFEQVFVPLVKE